MNAFRRLRRHPRARLQVQGHGAGQSFWWGSAQAHVGAYRQPWRDLHDTLTVTYGLDDLLWAYSPYALSDGGSLTSACPGQAYLDVVGTDFCGRMPLPTDDPIQRSLGKPLAMTEIGPDAASCGALDERAVAAAGLGRAACFLQWHSWPGARVSMAIPAGRPMKRPGARGSALTAARGPQRRFWRVAAGASPGSAGSVMSIRPS